MKQGNRMHQKKLLLRGALSIVLSLSMIFGSLPVGRMSMTVHAETPTKRITGLGTGAITDPVVPTSASSAWRGSYIYYGNYNNDPVKYRVLDSATNRFGGNTLFLDCNSTMFKSEFRYEYTAADAEIWSVSDVRKELNTNEDSFLNTGFTAIERAAITESSVQEHTIDVNLGKPARTWFPTYTALDHDKLFLLDFEDVLNTEYGYYPSCGLNAEAVGDAYYGTVENHKKSGCATWWWLRSPNRDDNVSGVGYVATPGYVRDMRGDTSKNPGGVCPAFNVDLSSVIFSTLVSGTAGQAGAAYKLTIKDENMEITSGTITREGTNIIVPYTISGSDADNANRVSVLITDSAYSAGTAVTSGYTYGMLETESWNTSGTGIFVLPNKYAGKEWGTDYHVYILAEDVNGEMETDYASVPVEIKAPVELDEVSADARGYEGVYDGQAHGISVNMSVPGTGATVFYGEIEETYDTNISPVITNAGDSPKTVYYLVTLGGYVIGKGSGEIRISKAPLTVKANDKTIIYGEEPSNDGAEYSGFVNSETTAVISGSLEYDYNYKKGNNAGTYTITPKGLSAENYEISYKAGILTVEKADPSVTFPVAKGDLSYTGQPQELLSAGTVTGGTMMYALGTDVTTAPAASAYTASIPAGTDAGTYYVWYKTVGDENHKDTEAVCVTVVIKSAEGNDPTSPDPVASTMLHAINVNTGAVAKNSKGEVVDTAKENEVISISWTARDDRDFVKWNLNGATAEDPVSANTVFKMGSSDVTVAFEEKLKVADEVKEALPEGYDTSVKVKKLKFENSKLTLKKNDKATANKAVTEADQTAPEVVYVTENKDIVAVDKSGNFYPMGVGEATVTAYCGNKKATCKVSVVSYTEKIVIRDTTEAVVNDTTIEMKGGEQAFLSVSFEPYDSTDPRNIKWKSNDKKVTVKNGIVTAKEVKEALTAEITATVKATGAEGGAITKKVTVHVTPTEVPAAQNKDKTHTLSLKKSLKMVTADDSNKTELDINLKAKKGGDIKSVQTISVRSTNPDVVSANLAGQLTVDGIKASAKATLSANKAGTAYIIVTTSSDGGKTVNVKRCKVTVSSPAKDISVESGSLAVTDNKITMRKGSSGTVEVKLDPEFSTDLGKVKLSGSKGIKVKNGIIYAIKVTGENKPAKLTVKCGKLRKVIEVVVR